MTNKEMIAAILARAETPLSRQEIAWQTGENGKTLDADGVSPYLTDLRKSGDVVQTHDAKWTLSQRGQDNFGRYIQDRATSSQRDATASPVDEQEPDRVAARYSLDELGLIEREDHGDCSPNMLERISERIALRKFDTQDPRDRAILDLVDIARESKIPSLENREAKLALLGKFQNAAVFSVEDRALMSHIRLDLEQLTSD